MNERQLRAKKLLLEEEHKYLGEELKKINARIKDGEYIKDPNMRDHFFNIGENYLIRTVTFTYLGNLMEVGEKELLIGDASWIANTGRFSNMLKEGVTVQESSKIEPCNADIVIGRGAIVDMIPYNHELPTKQK